MSTILNTNGAELEIPTLRRKGKFHIVTAQWNPSITYALRDGAIDVLRRAGVDEKDIHSHAVPGTVELVYAASLLTRQKDAAGVIIIGCVIRGDTPHFDYVCQQVAQGTATLNAEGKVPVIFGVLTVDSLPQAEERAGGALGNKGAEAAVAAIEMANFTTDVANSFS